MQARTSALLGELSSHTPSHGAEARDLERMLAFARAHPDPFSRTLLPGHFTGSGLVATDKLDRVVLLHHRKLDLWLQCGGHVEPTDASPLAAAVREAHEETGLGNVRSHPRMRGLVDVDIHDIPARGDMPAHEHLDLRYVLLADPATPLDAPASEALDIGWFTWDQLAAMDLDDGLARLLGKVEAVAKRL